MPRAVILGEPSSGSTTFVALLYSTLVRTAVEREDEFRFAVAPESVDLLTGMYAQLMSGELPGTPRPEEIATMRLTLAFSRRNRGRSWLGKSTDYSGVPKVECRWVQARFEQIEASLRGGDTSADPTASLIECTIPIFLLPVTGFGPDVSSSNSTGQSLDHSVMSVLHGLARPFEVARRPSGEALHPIVVFTQLDGCSPEALGRFGLKSPLDDNELEQQHRRLSSAFLEEFIPKTAEYCGSAGSAVGAPEVFFSFLQTETGEGGEARVKVWTAADHSRQPVYARNQFQALISYLGALAL